jgi:phenylacetate-CoA ligase
VRRQPGLSPEYLIVLDRADVGLPRLTIQVEALGDPAEPGLREAVAAELRGGLGVSPDVEVLPLGALPRPERGKARRVVDHGP